MMKWRLNLHDLQAGESCMRIVRYAVPELISAFVIYSLPFWVDAWFIGQLSNTCAYATLGATNNLIHFIFKLSEAFSVGTVIMVGTYNGRHDDYKVGRTVRDSFWTICFIGLLCSGFLYSTAFYIYRWYGVPADIAQLGVPFLQLRAIGIFFMFMCMALIGFLRGIKNTQIPMIAFIMGGMVFLLTDYLFIFGNYGMPALGLQGSALASVMQYAVMFFLLSTYVFKHREYSKYALNLFEGVTDFAYVRHLFSLSWPIMVDKATMAWSYIWLCKMINPMGTNVIASFCVLKDMERCAFLPALAFAQVITFLVSNDYGAHSWHAIQANIKKVCIMTAVCVGTILLIFLQYTEPIIRFFDKKGEFTPLAAKAFPFISVLVLIDLLQLVLSGALRGAGNVRVVMYTRLLICAGYFVPLSYLISQIPFQSTFLKFVLIYSSFYIGNALMSILYITRFSGDAWKVSSAEGNV